MNIRFATKILLVIISFCLLGGVCVAQSFKNLETAELKLYSTSFNYEPLDKRLNRLETTMFARRFNDPVEYRIKRIEQFVAPKSFPDVAVKPVASKSQQSVQASSDTGGYPVISLMEKKVFRQSFPQNNIYSRLLKLETQVFGATFPDKALADRVDDLARATKIELPDYSNDNDIDSPTYYDRDNSGYNDDNSGFNSGIPPQNYNTQSYNGNYSNNNYANSYYDPAYSTVPSSGGGFWNILKTFALPFIDLLLEPSAYNSDYGNDYGYGNDPYYNYGLSNSRTGYSSYSNYSPYMRRSGSTSGSTGAAVRIMP